MNASISNPCHDINAINLHTLTNDDEKDGNNWYQQLIKHFDGDSENGNVFPLQNEYSSCICIQIYVSTHILIVMEYVSYDIHIFNDERKYFNARSVCGAVILHFSSSPWRVNHDQHVLGQQSTLSLSFILFSSFLTFSVLIQEEVKFCRESLSKSKDEKCLFRLKVKELPSISNSSLSHHHDLNIFPFILDNDYLSAMSSSVILSSPPFFASPPLQF